MLDALADYFRMGGYAFYVWWSYAIAGVVLALNLIVPSLKLRRVRRALARSIRPPAPSPEAPTR